MILCLTVLASVSAARETTYVYPPKTHTLGFDRVGEWELKLFLGIGASIDNPQGLAAVKLKSQDDPNDAKDDIFLTLYGVNSGKGQIVYNPTRFEVDSFGKKGSGRERFQDPMGIAANEDGQVAVADFGNRRVVFLRMEGKKLVWVGELAAFDGSIHPTDVDWAAGRFWIADASGGRILTCGPAGERPELWRHEGDPLRTPRGLCVTDPQDPWSRGDRFQVLVVDDAGRRIRLFDEKGREVIERGAEDILDSRSRFLYPASDLYGNFVLADSVQGRLIKLDSKLKTLAVLDKVDEDPRPLDKPRGVAIWRRYGQVFVVEEKGGAYLWTGTDIFDARASWAAPPAGQQALLVEYRISEASLVSYYALKNGMEIELRAESRRGPGDVKQWIQPDDKLQGAEALLIRARPSFSAKKSLQVDERVSIPRKGM